MTHTPGPWRARYSEFYIDILGDNDNDIVCTMSEMLRYDHGNADLIAAAPELLRLLINCYDLMQQSGAFVKDAPIFTEIEAAIAKATGKE